LWLPIPLRVFIILTDFFIGWGKIDFRTSLLSSKWIDNTIMKLVRKKNQKTTESHTNSSAKIKAPCWKVLIVDDEPDIHSMTRLSLKNFQFSGKKLQIFEALSGVQARQILTQEPDIAVALIDVVMESDDAGLQLVEFIRTQLNYSLIRLIVRTGQPGMAPEKEVIERYDIDDYKDKGELTAQKLYTMMRAALKSYRDLSILDTNRKALKKILDSAPELYHPKSLSHFFDGVLTQIIGLCNLGENSLISSGINGLVITSDNNQIAIQSGTGRFAQADKDSEVDKIVHKCFDYINDAENASLPNDVLIIPLLVHKKPVGFVYLEGTECISKDDKALIHIMANQCATALENLQLYLDLKEANRQTSYMLAIAEQARKMAEAANQAKTSFLARMSHELRTPLNAILGYSDMIQEEASEQGYQDILPDLDKIQVAGKQLLDTISNILDISKIESDKLELNLTEFAVSDLVKEVVTTIQPLIKIHGNQFEFHQNDDLGRLYADYHKVTQVLLNILNNANKFTHGGQIILNVNRKRLSKLAAEQPNNELPLTSEVLDTFTDWVFFQITDTGIGIPSEKLNLIFEAFTQVDISTTREFGGSGLGLAICEHFCKAMGGKISVCSTIGKGSTFTIQLPTWVTHLSGK
jgi:signal transduction histidine kinase/CheY-like chemotaxis protein